MIANKLQQGQYIVKHISGSEILNQPIFNKAMALKKEDIEHESHLFNGRYENIYIKEHAIRELQSILDHIKQEIASLLEIPEQQIKLGFWLNIMQPGEQTTLHCHDDFDEVISGVYYINVPENSGNLVLKTDRHTEIKPAEGMMVLFSPALEHYVTENKSSQVRLSIGFNATTQT